MDTTASIGRAHPRIGLLGNPSDGYGGCVLAMTFGDFGVEVEAREHAEFVLAAGSSDEVRRTSLDAVVEEPSALPGAAGLIAAALKRATERLAATGDAELLGRAARPRVYSVSSDIPRQAGLSGSSAIVIATLRALDAAIQTPFPRAVLAELAWRAEVVDLRIAAGPQDRVIQAYEGLRLMDFADPADLENHRALPPALLPPLFVAHDPRPGAPSGDAHAELRRRFESRDPVVRSAMTRFRAIALEGTGALERGDAAAFRRAVDENFDLRATLWNIGERDRAMIELGRRLGAATKFCGSGGAIVGVLEDESQRSKVDDAYRAAGFPILRPRPVGAAS